MIDKDRRRTDSRVLATATASSRYMLAERIASYAKSNSLCTDRNLYRTKDSKNRAYYAIKLQTDKDSRVTIKVYSEKYVIVNFQKPYKLLPDRFSTVFKREAELLEFIDAAFVKHDDALTVQALGKSV